MRLSTLWSQRPAAKAAQFCAILALVACNAWSQFGDAPPVRLPPAAVGRTLAATPGRETVVLAGGCFWGIQAVFQHVQGVTRAVSGYAGGERDTAHYETVGSGQTGHAESVEVTFDPSVVSLADLLRVYFSVAHDPTEVNRQGPDTGSQYRSAIFYKDDKQKKIAEAYIGQLDQGKFFPARIATELSPLKGFFPAEDYHQDYATLHPDAGYIARFDLPKLRNLKQFFPELYRPAPVLVAAH